jgi:hypothetical protein
MSKNSPREKGLTPTDCAKLYVRYCLQNLPYNTDAFAEVVDCASLNDKQYKAVEKALQIKLASLIKKIDKSLGKHAPGVYTIAEAHGAKSALAEWIDGTEFRFVA